MSRFLSAYVLSPFGPGNLRPLFSGKKPEDLAYVASLLADGDVRPVIDAVRDLRDAAEAIAAVHTGHARGKVVLAP
jgi:NADPH:quinone reductase-like Zn-dependent oxidoreductase